MHNPSTHRLLLAVVVIVVIAPAAVFAASSEINQTFDVRPGQELTLAFDRMRGDIDIEGWDQNRIEITGSIRGGDWEEDDELEFYQSSGGIDVAPSYRPRGDDRVKADLKIKLPRKFNLRLDAAMNTRIRGLEGELELSVANARTELVDVHGPSEISTANGRLTVKKCTLDGEVSAVNGGLRIDDSDVKGEVASVNGGMNVSRAPEGIDLRSTNGSVEVGMAQHVRAKTTNGSVSIDELAGWIQAKTVNGSVSFRMVGSPSGRHDVDIETLNGNVEIEIPENFSMDFDIEVKNDGTRRRYEIISDFDLDIESKDMRRNRYRVRGTGEIGGGRNTVHIRATNGDVILTRVATTR